MVDIKKLPGFPFARRPYDVVTAVLALIALILCLVLTSFANDSQYGAACFFDDHKKKKISYRL